MPEKRCKSCGKRKDYQCFPAYETYHPYHTRNETCYACAEQKERTRVRGGLKKRYSLALDDYEQLFTAQQGVCAICQKPPTEVATKSSWTQKRLAVDHDHVTGLIRGLLCQACNHGLGNFRDDPALLLRAVTYLLDAQTTDTGCE